MTPVDDHELALTAAGWRKLRSGRWHHPRHHQQGRCRPMPIDEALADEARHAPPAPLSRVELARAISIVEPEWCGVTHADNDPED